MSKVVLLNEQLHLPDKLFIKDGILTIIINNAIHEYIFNPIAFKKGIIDCRELIKI